jgi:hypothetical protein
MEKNNGTAQGQIEKLRQFASQSDIAGVAISVIQAENVAIVEEMKNLAAKGVKVITVDGDVNRSMFRDARPYYIGTDNIVGGRLLGAVSHRRPCGGHALWRALPLGLGLRLGARQRQRRGKRVAHQAVAAEVLDGAD